MVGAVDAPRAKLWKVFDDSTVAEGTRCFTKVHLPNRIVPVSFNLMMTSTRCFEC